MVGRRRSPPGPSKAIGTENWQRIASPSNKFTSPPLKYVYARVNTPVAAGNIVSVFGETILKAAVLNVQKQTSFPAPAPLDVRITANLIFLSDAPEAVNTKPTVV